MAFGMNEAEMFSGILLARITARRLASVLRTK
jgi:hypothetical protein